MMPKCNLSSRSCFCRSARMSKREKPPEGFWRSPPGEEGALLLLANTAVTPVEFQEIRKVIEDFRGADKDRAAYHVALGTLALREKDRAVAQREFNAALDLDSTSSAALAGLASIYWSLNQLPEAGRTFKFAADLSPTRSPIRLRYVEFLNHNGSSPGSAGEAAKV